MVQRSINPLILKSELQGGKCSPSRPGHLTPKKKPSSPLILIAHEGYRDSIHDSSVAQTVAQSQFMLSWLLAARNIDLDEMGRTAVI
jgi:hypothetical protein